MKRYISAMLVVVMILMLNAGTDLNKNKVHGETVQTIGENIAYERTATASSVESEEHSASKAVDGDGNTRWSSSFADNQNLIIDLWSSQIISCVKISWESAYAAQYQIQISNDSTTWTTVYENYNGSGGTETIRFSSVNARYVKLYCIKRATEYGFSVYEFEIYRESTSDNTDKDNIAGKTFFFLGSSVTYGYASGGVSFVDYIAERNSCTCVKEAVSGTTLVDNGSDSYVQRMLNKFDASANCNHFVCQLSTNDASQNLPLGSVSDSFDLSDFNKSTIIGAMEYIICYAKSTWNCPVTFFTNTYYDSANYQQMVDALYKLQEKWGIGIIDLWNNEDMRNVSASDYARYMSDNIHPTSAGYLEWWTPVFETYFEKFDYSAYEQKDLSDAGKAKENVLQYFYDIQGKQTVVGIHNREPNSEPAKQTNQAYAITGQYPALWSGDFLFSSSDVENRWNMIYECKNQWENGSIVQLMLHVTPPTQQEAGNWDGGVVSHLSDEQWNSLITDGGELNKAWKTRLDTYSVYLQYLKDNGVPVLFRPFHEMNQGIFWWAGRKGSSGTAALYRLTRDYLENEKGLDNIIWVWDVQDLSYDWSEYNPGDEYWDIFAVDVYNSDYFTSYKYDQALMVAGNKLIAIGECDKLPTASQLKEQPRWSFVMSWAELTFSYNTNTEIQNLYWAENVIVRNELPDLKDKNGEETTTPPQEETDTDSPIVTNNSVNVKGYQISTTLGGSRVVSSVESVIDGKNVEKTGFVYALVQAGDTVTNIKDSDMFVGSENKYVASFESTDKGTMIGAQETSDTAKNYVMTTLFEHKNAQEFSAKYKVRAYALLSDGSYVYSKVCTYSVYDVASALYNGRKMSTYAGHSYLYDHILTLVNPSYGEIEYDWSAILTGK